MMLRFKNYFLGFLFIVFWVFFFAPQVAFSQIEKGEIEARIETGYKYMIAGNYKKADDEFRFVLDNATSLPPDE